MKIVQVNSKEVEGSLNVFKFTGISLDFIDQMVIQYLLSDSRQFPLHVFTFNQGMLVATWSQLGLVFMVTGLSFNGSSGLLLMVIDANLHHKNLMKFVVCLFALKLFFKFLMTSLTKYSNTQKEWSWEFCSMTPKQGKRYSPPL